MLSQGDVASLFFLPCWRLVRHPLVSPPPWGVQHPSPTVGQAQTSEPPSSPLSWRGNLRTRGEGLRAAAVGMPRAVEQSTTTPSRNQLPKHPACGPLTPWLPGLEEGPLSHETTIRCPLTGTQSARSSLERARSQTRRDNPRAWAGVGGAYTEDTGEGWELRMGRPCSQEVWLGRMMRRRQLEGLWAQETGGKAYSSAGGVEVKVGEAGGPSGFQALPGCWEVNWVCPKGRGSLLLHASLGSLGSLSGPQSSPLTGLFIRAPIQHLLRVAGPHLGAHVLTTQCPGQVPGLQSLCVPCRDAGSDIMSSELHV